MELQWQREVIERWMNTPNIPSDARASLLELLVIVKADLNKLEEAQNNYRSSRAS
jgi:hypothetical protein